MINILLPMAGHSNVSEEMGYPYPPPLIELKSRPMIEHVVQNLSEVDDEHRFVYILQEKDCKKYHLDNTVLLLSPKDSVIVRLPNETKGALCSSLMAVTYIYNDLPLLIANSDQLFEEGVLNRFVQEMRKKEADAGALYFTSVHPRWAYVRLEGESIVEAVEKNPISKCAISGIYYFSSGRLFIDAAKQAIMNGRETEGKYFLSSVFNELILKNCRVLGVPVDNEKYHSFFTPQRIEEYERASRP